LKDYVMPPETARPRPAKVVPCSLDRSSPQTTEQLRLELKRLEHEKAAYQRQLSSARERMVDAAIRGLDRIDHRIAEVRQELGI
jgi:hypothetical protein